MTPFLTIAAFFLGCVVGIHSAEIFTDRRLRSLLAIFLVLSGVAVAILGVLR